MKKVIIYILSVIMIVLICVASYWYFVLQVPCCADDEAYIPPQYHRSDEIDPIDDADLSAEEYPGPIQYDESELVYDGDAPVYVTIYSHNEDSWQWLVNTQDKYVQYRNGLIERAELLAEYGIEWNWQTDQPVVEAMLEYEDDSKLLERTGGVNILKYLESLGASFDPHAHTNNYADIAYLIEQMGVRASSVIGGTIFIACGSEHLGFLDFESWWENVGIASDGLVYGSDYPFATWKPEILSDPGKGGHSYDEWSSGIWNPGDEDEFYVHFPDSDITYIGEGYPHDATIIGEEHASGTGVFAEDGRYIRELVAKIKDGEVPTGTIDGEKFIYTASIHVRDTDVVTEGRDSVNTVEGLRAVLEELLPLANDGEIIFVNYEDVAEIWEAEYNSVPWRLDLFDFSFYHKVRAEAEELCESSPRNQ